MSLLERVKSGDFLSATLDLSQPSEVGQWTLPNGVQFALISRGILQVIPAKIKAQTKDIVLSCGVHGDETAPIEIIDQLTRKLVLGEIEPKHRLLLIIAHPEAVNAHTREIDENLNRLFATEQDEETKEQEIANRLQHSVRYFFCQSDVSPLHHWHLDLHCAIRESKHHTFALSPFSSEPSRGQGLFAFIQQAKLDAILLSNRLSGTFTSFSANEFGAQAATLELGRVAAFGENDLTILAPFIDALESLVTTLTLNETRSIEDSITTYRVARTLLKETEAFTLLFPKDIANFTFFDAGTPLAIDNNKTMVADEGGESILFPNANVGLGQRACLLVKKARLIAGEQMTIAESSFL